MTDYILGGGVTGLAAGMASGFKVLEATNSPGGICASYYLRPASDTPLSSPPADQNAYRFEIGGGHWIFGGDEAVLRLLGGLSQVQRYQRRSACYFAKSDLFVDYPLQNNLRTLGPDVAKRIVGEIEGAQASIDMSLELTMKRWLLDTFGPTLGEMFFLPFHERYTAGLYDRIAPQDGYKSPIDIERVKEGAERATNAAVGYNVTFLYPQGGLDSLARTMARQCSIDYESPVVSISTEQKELVLQGGESRRYERLLVTLPLDKVLTMVSLPQEFRPDPYTSVLVVNVGALRGKRCPDAHWIYVPDSDAGFFRVGFYSNVDSEFVPASSRAAGDRVSIYVEKAYPGGAKPTELEQQRYVQAVIAELQSWGFIGDVEVAHGTWVDSAYTWSWPGSRWRRSALELLAQHGVQMVGRYARWHFQGIAESIGDGLVCGAVERWV